MLVECLDDIIAEALSGADVALADLDGIAALPARAHRGFSLG